MNEHGNIYKTRYLSSFTVLQRFPNVCICDHAHNLNLVCNLLQDTPHVLVPFYKSKFGVFQSLLFCKLFDEKTCFAEVVTRETGEEVVRDLEMETAVDELDVRGANHVHRGP